MLLFRPQSVRNSCVRERFGGVLHCNIAPLSVSVAVGEFVIKLNQIFFFFSLPRHMLQSFMLCVTVIQHLCSFLF